MGHKLNWSKLIAQGVIGALCGFLIPSCLFIVPTKILGVFGVPTIFLSLVTFGAGFIGGITYGIICMRKEMQTQVKEQRRGSGECTECGYDLQGITSERCPECGSLILDRPNSFGSSKSIM
jgi:predicted RNA-binding Zn-ribbon protein involved in translation (DUF1610 family)